MWVICQDDYDHNDDNVRKVNVNCHHLHQLSIQRQDNYDDNADNCHHLQQCGYYVTEDDYDDNNDDVANLFSEISNPIFDVQPVACV